MVWFNEHHNVVFIHNPKTAGTAIEEAFKRISGTTRLGGKHTTLPNMIKRFPRHNFNKYQSFAFVRNPWDRVVSLYAFYNKQKRNKEKAAPNIGETFASWVERAFTVKQDKVELYHQCHWTDGVQTVRYFEQLDEEIDNISKLFDIKLGRLNKVNVTPHRQYQEMYCDKTINIVGEYFKRDIDTYGYTFGDDK